MVIALREEISAAPHKAEGAGTLSIRFLPGNSFLDAKWLFSYPTNPIRLCTCTESKSARISLSAKTA